MSALKEVGKGITLIIPLIELGQWVAGRVRARRAARKAGKTPAPVTAETVKEGIERGLNALPPIHNARVNDALDTVRDIADIPTPPQTPRGKGLR